MEFPQWLQRKVKVDQLPNIRTTSSHIKLEDFGNHAQMKFTTPLGQIGIAKQRNREVVTVFFNPNENEWHWTRQYEDKQVGSGKINEKMFEWEDVSQFPQMFREYFHDKLQVLPMINIADRQQGRQTRPDYFTMEDFDVKEFKRSNHALRFVDNFGRPGLVVNHQDGNLTVLYQQNISTPSEWISLTYQPSAKDNEIVTNVIDEDDLIQFIEPIGKQLYFVLTK